MFAIYRNSHRYARKPYVLLIMSGMTFAFFMAILTLNLTTVYADEQVRSSSLNVEKTTDGDTERIDYVDEDGNITYAADKHYATVIKTKKGNTLLEQYYDAEGKPAVQNIGHYALLREYNDKNQDYKITYLGIDGNPIIIRSGYSIVIRTFNAEGHIDSEMYYDTDGKPVETNKLGYGCIKEYNENGRNTRITYLDQYHNPTISGQGFSTLCRSFYEEEGLAGKVKEEYYFGTDGTPISLSLGQYGMSREYDDLGREIVLTYLDVDGSPIITNEGYTVVKKTYNEDGSIKTETYYDIAGNPVSLSEGQYGYRVVDGDKIYIDSEGNDLFILRNYLYSHQISVIIICIIVVFISAIMGKKLNIALLLFYLLFIFYMTFFYRKPGQYSYNLKPFWSYIQFLYNKELRWEIINNILLFIPLGSILSKILPQKRVLLLVAGLSFLIELVQLITGIGLCEIDDLISNSFGGLTGFIIGMLFMSIRNKFVFKQTA